MLIYQCENCQHEILPRDGQGMLEWGCDHCHVMYRLSQEEVDDWYLQQELPGSTFYIPPNDPTEPVEWPDGSWHRQYYWWTYREPRPPYEQQIGYGRRYTYLDPSVMMAIRDPAGMANAPSPLSFRQRLRMEVLDAAKRVMPSMTDNDLMRFSLMMSQDFPQLRATPQEFRESLEVVEEEPTPTRRWHVDYNEEGSPVGGVQFEEPEGYVPPTLEEIAERARRERARRDLWGDINVIESEEDPPPLPTVRQDINFSGGETFIPPVPTTPLEEIQRMSRITEDEIEAIRREVRRRELRRLGRITGPTAEEREAIIEHYGGDHEWAEVAMEPVELENFDYELRRRTVEYRDRESLEYHIGEEFESLLETQTPQEKLYPPAHWR